MTNIQDHTTKYSRSAYYDHGMNGIPVLVDAFYLIP